MGKDKIRALSSFFTWKGCVFPDSIIVVIQINPSAPSLLTVIQLRFHFMILCDSSASSSLAGFHRPLPLKVWTN